ncbi:MAG: type IV secretory system conjugative DNA transfer family protein [Lactobacillus sp.]|nr:type IV secretory system conjugative DNA transfer family protein [Lactobacillus sp.]
MKKFRILHYLFLIIFAVILAMLCFFVFSLLFFFVSYLIRFGFTEKAAEMILACIKDPNLILTVYRDWIVELKETSLSVYLLLPLLAPISFFILTVYILARAVSRRIKNVYAKEEDLVDMGLSTKGPMLLGKLGNTFIKLGKAFSILVWGEKGMGKTSSVAISSILASDMVNIIAMDEDGVLARYTSGHRKTIGEVFYFDLDEADNPQEGKFLPRWNPLSASNIPPRGRARDEYLASIANNLTSRKKDYWGKLLNVAVEGLLVCFVDKIEQAFANDYFLDKLMSEGNLSKEDEDTLISYYAVMPKKYAIPAIANVMDGSLNVENYLPIGSWGQVPEAWKGKELNLSFCYDTLMQFYFKGAKNSEDGEIDGWKVMLDNFIKEAKVFGYSKRAIEILEYLFYLSRKQRKIVFTLILEIMAMFRLPNIRQRTSVSDVTNVQLRGAKDDIEGKIKPVTVYIKAKSETAKLLARFMFDVMMDLNMQLKKHLNPVIVVIDDFDKFGKLNSLIDILKSGFEKNISSLLLTHNFEELYDKYGESGLEGIVNNTGYKVFLAKNNPTMTKHLQYIMRFATKALQIPQSFNNALLKKEKCFSDASYYARIAKGLSVEKKSEAFKKGDALILVEGYYYLPIKARAVFFLQDESLRPRSKAEPIYELDKLLMNKRNMQDVNSPTLDDVLQEVGVRAKSQEEVYEYLEDKLGEVAEEIDKIKDKDTVLVEDISARWKTIEPIKSEAASYSDWWLEEDAFELVQKEEMNPFK